MNNAANTYAGISILPVVSAGWDGSQRMCTKTCRPVEHPSLTSVELWVQNQEQTYRSSCTISQNRQQIYTTWQNLCSISGFERTFDLQNRHWFGI